MKRWTVNLMLVAAMVLVFAVSFVVGGHHTDPAERFAGTDATVTTQLEESGFEPWFTPFFAPESSEVESGLFALQAGLGGTAFGFALGALWGLNRRRPQPAARDEVPQAS